MNIVHVVTLITPDGAYGGPVRVAFNQSRQLRADNHQVVVVGTSRGFSPTPEILDGTPVRLTKARTVVPFTGFSGIASPSMLWFLIRTRRKYDVVHVHLARDLVTLPAALLALILGKRVVVQTHGMIIESKNRIAPVLDLLLTRPVLRRVHTAFYLTDEERRSLLNVEPGVVLKHLPNGVPIYGSGAKPAGTPAVEVLYLARLHGRKRPQMFVEAAIALLTEGTEATFRLVGPDEGEAKAVSDAIAAFGDTNRLDWEGALPPERTVERMAGSSVYVLPSIDEPFPMSVLEAMAVGLPVVVTQSCGLAALVKESGSGLVIDESKDALVGAIRTLVNDPELRTRMGTAAHRTAVDVFSMEAVTRNLLSAYGFQSSTSDR